MRNSTTSEAVETVADLEIYGLSYRTIEALDRHGVMYLEQLELLPDADMMAWEMFGPGDRRQVRTALANYYAGRIVRSIHECTYGGD